MVPKLPPEILPRIRAYLELLDHWNQRYALTSLDPTSRMEELVLDSAALFPFLGALPPGARIVDFGSGMGIPAVPLALFRPDLEVAALDKARKKMAFLRQVARELPVPNLVIHEGRAEDLPPLSADAGTAKATGSPLLLSAWWDRHGKPGAPFWALKGPLADSEPLPEGWNCRFHNYELPTRGPRRILEMEKPRGILPGAVEPD